ncbi:MAG: nucleobase:cation symporter-2 family protein [Actinomycetota bacterium]|nr:nucleobase:cation symporter-2 family protein [Actinomycetota bacterium]
MLGTQLAISQRRWPAPDGETHPVDELPKPGRAFVLGLQHMLAAYAGIIAPPLIIGTGLHLPFIDITLLITLSLFASGLVTILQTVGVPKLGVRLPLVEGVSFSGIASMLVIGKLHPDPTTAMQIIVGSVIVSSAIMFFLSSVYAKMLRFFPPLVLGSVVTVIGLTLVPISIGWMQGTAGTKSFGSTENVGLAILTLLITVLVARYVPGFVKRVSMLVGIVVATLVAIPLGETNFHQVSSAAVFSLPHFLMFGTPRFELGAIVSMVIVMLVIMTEATCDIMAIGRIVDVEVKEQDVANCLRADCLGSVFSALLNGFQCSAYGQNIGIVQVSRVKSRFVVATCGAILVILGLFPFLSAIVAAVPLPVLGGAGIAIFGLVAVTGIQTLARHDWSGENGVVDALIVASTLTMGIIPTAAPAFYAHFPDWFQTIFGSGIASGAITAIVLNLILNEIPLIVAKRRSGSGLAVVTATQSLGEA